jgi:hypothetical protein
VSIKYCLDSGVFINSWQKHYPPEVFPCVWDCFQTLITSKIAIIPRAVYEELEKERDDVFNWVKWHAETLIADPDEDVIQSLRVIMKDHGRLVDTKKHRSIADPWVIAHAQAAGAAVVTEENESNGKSPKIPDVCNALGIPCMRTVELLRACSVVAK